MRIRKSTGDLITERNNIISILTSTRLSENLNEQYRLQHTNAERSNIESVEIRLFFFCELISNVVIDHKNR